MVSVSQAPPASRKLFALFVATTLLPALGLAWLGWRLAQQDRALEQQRHVQVRDHAADLGATTLQRLLAEAEEGLATVAAAPAARIPDLLAAPGTRGGQFSILVFTGAGLAARSGTPLPFQPALPPGAEPPAAAFEAAEVFEFRQGQYAGAIRLLEALARSPDPAVRAGALVRLARNQRKAGDHAGALRSFRRLAELGDTPVNGLPAGLLARQGAALLFEETGQTANLQQEAAALAEDLRQSRWALTRATYEFQLQQLRRWTSASGGEDSSLRALAEAAETVWSRWAASPASPTARRISLGAGGIPVLILARSSADRLALVLLGAHYLEAAWLGELKRLGATQQADFALTDPEGRAVIGDPALPVALQSVRTASATKLPWTVHAIGPKPAAGMPGRSRLLLAGILLMAVLVLGGGYFTFLAISRELRVARLQADFVASVSHEFRTPLTTMRQLSEMLVQDRVSSPERRTQFYEVLLRESNRLHRLVEGLLQFGRMEAGQAPVRFELVDPGAFVRQVSGEFRPEAAKTGHQVELELDEALPRIRADRESLARVLWNLLDNAVKYSPGAPAVWIQAAAADRGVAIRVRDRGFGIPPEDCDRVFEKFVRGAAARDAAIPGTGVGLAMARQIVAAHRGRLSLESKVGEGSVFTILLPSGE
jgi:signal transduction histidine kinase